MNDISTLHRWVWLSLACGAGSTVPELLISVFGDIDSIYEAGEEEYAELELKLPCMTELCNKSLDQAMRTVKWCEQKKVGILTPDDPRYPSRLYGTHAFPAVLYYFGRIPEIDKRLTIAGVGTRRMTEYGSNNAYAICRDLAKEGAIIVSGLALGIDAVCHRAALDVGGMTVAVLGCGLDYAYPPQNRDLMVEIARKGVIFTEYAPGTEPLKKNFPMRNRIISGLSNATVVFEADENSGSLITARRAMKQGRPVYALPGNTGTLSSLGTNELLTNGAFAVTKAGDILENFKEYILNIPGKTVAKAPKLPKSPVKTIVNGFEAVPNGYKKPKVIEVSEPKNLETSNDAINDAVTTPQTVTPEREPLLSKPVINTKEKQKQLVDALNLTERTIYGALSRTEPKTNDELTSTGYPINKINAALTMLEVKGLVLSLAGGYVKV
ncbi:MAG: DNA-processing protein DprA [Clostridia bacterium]|nr:DNA-processing protein DprA [Clostridia bacterium]